MAVEDFNLFFLCTKENYLKMKKMQISKIFFVSKIFLFDSGKLVMKVGKLKH